MGRIPSLKNFNALPHAEDHLLKKTYSGAIGTWMVDLLELSLMGTCVFDLPFVLACLTVTIIGLIIMVTLFAHELTFYLTTYTMHQVWRLLF